MPGTIPRAYLYPQKLSRQIFTSFSTATALFLTFTVFSTVFLVSSSIRLLILSIPVGSTFLGGISLLLKSLVFYIFLLPLQIYSIPFSVLFCALGRRSIWTVSMVSLAFRLPTEFSQQGELAGGWEEQAES